MKGEMSGEDDICMERDQGVYLKHWGCQALSAPALSLKMYTHPIVVGWRHSVHVCVEYIMYLKCISTTVECN